MGIINIVKIAFVVATVMVAVKIFHSLYVNNLAMHTKPQNAYVGSGEYSRSLANDVHITMSESQMQSYLEQRAVKVKEVDCLKLFQNEEREMEKALSIERSVELPSESHIHELASDCSQFLQHYGFVMDPLTDLENQFPIAFSIIAYKSACEVVDLLRAVYRPQNVYCIHVDKTSSSEFRMAMESVSRCLPGNNVFVASRAIDVRWGTFTVLEPEIVCMEDLWRRSRTWKYFINLTGQEFPLKTNYELVRILMAYNGANDIAGRKPEHFAQRWRKALPVPHNLTMYKGATHIVASRGYVDYVLHSPVAQDFLQWCKNTSHAAEHFFNTLNRNPQLPVPGRYLGNKLEAGEFKTMPKDLLRYKNWVPRYPCPGHKVVRDICILNSQDLPALYRRPEPFANKFYADYSHVALQCLAEELHNRTRDYTLGRRGDFNVTIYEQLATERDAYGIFSE